jgi:GNAT superfamily N-acetyltransferase
MIFREATIKDIPQMQVVRNSVKENALSNPALVPDKDYETYLNLRGKGWVCDINGTIVGFAIADVVDHNIWALFLHPDFEQKGIGKQLHNLMLNWYFSQTQQTVWLGTAPGTRAEVFYTKRGWTRTGTHGKGEVKFEMSHADWIKNTDLLSYGQTESN